MSSANVLLKLHLWRYEKPDALFFLTITSQSTEWVGGFLAVMRSHANFQASINYSANSVKPSGFNVVYYLSRFMHFSCYKTTKSRRINAGSSRHIFVKCGRRIEHPTSCHISFFFSLPLARAFFIVHGCRLAFGQQTAMWICCLTGAGKRLKIDINWSEWVYALFSLRWVFLLLMSESMRVYCLSEMFRVSWGAWIILESISLLGVVNQ